MSHDDPTPEPEPSPARLRAERIAALAQPLWEAQPTWMVRIEPAPAGVWTVRIVAPVPVAPVALTIAEWDPEPEIERRLLAAFVLLAERVYVDGLPKARRGVA
jgi:hypothetical protein